LDSEYKCSHLDGYCSKPLLKQKLIWPDFRLFSYSQLLGKNTENGQKQKRIKQELAPGGDPAPIYQQKSVIISEVARIEQI